MATGHKTGGRVKGTPNKRTAETKAAIQKVVAQFEATHPTAFDGDAVALMQLIYRDPSQDISLRLDAAKTAARFERPTLSAVATRDMTPVPSTRAETDVRIRQLLEKGLAHVTIDVGGTDAGAERSELDGSGGVVAGP
jgi:hypothetical protein